MKNSIVFVVFLLFFVAPLSAQTLVNVLEKPFELCNEKKGNERFKGQILKGKRNGMGFLLYRKELFYAGDFYRGEIQGYGMQIAMNEEPIKNCDDCVVYVGNWNKGKKNGLGSCYNNKGLLIYKGSFIDDKPIGSYPDPNVISEGLFLVSKDDKGDIYMCEANGQELSGFGVVIGHDGEMWQSMFKSNKRVGVGLLSYADGDWETINLKGGDYTIVSSSEEYAKKDEVRKKNNRIVFFGESGSWSESLTQLSQQLRQLSNRMSAGNTNNWQTLNTNIRNLSATMEKDRNTQKRNESQASETHSLSEVQSKNSESKVYGRYETQLIQMNAYYETKYSDSQRRDIQRKMKEIRTKWENRGFSMFYSDWEDWNGVKR